MEKDVFDFYMEGIHSAVGIYRREGTLGDIASIARILPSKHRGLSEEYVAKIHELFNMDNGIISHMSSNELDAIGVVDDVLYPAYARLCAKHEKAEEKCCDVAEAKSEPYTDIKDIIMQIDGVFDMITTPLMDFYYRGQWIDMSRDRAFMNKFINGLMDEFCMCENQARFDFNHVDIYKYVAEAANCISDTGRKAADEVLKFITRCSTPELRQVSLCFIYNEWSHFVTAFNDHLKGVGDD